LQTDLENERRNSDELAQQLEAIAEDDIKHEEALKTIKSALDTLKAELQDTNKKLADLIANRSTPPCRPHRI
jgi:chromosome segregation ATPase